MPIKPTTWEDMVQVDIGRLYYISFSGEIQIAPVICILVNCLLILLNTYHVLTLMFLRVIHL
jgi:hypothetical protein